MNQQLIFIPVLAQILLVLMLYIRLKMEKTKAIELGAVDHKKAALDNDAWPDNVIKVSNNIRNQFETPVLFYVLAIMLFSVQGVDAMIISLAWIYVLSRYVHAYIHTGSNYVPYRFKAFLVGLLILLFFTLWLVRLMVFPA